MPAILTDIALDKLNTFAVKAKASAFLQIDDLQQLQDCYQNIKAFKQRFILGGGSNLLFIDNYPGLVIYPQLKGIDILSQDSQTIRLKVSASENWHDFVGYCVANCYYGLENLALIPGTVGAAPVQNIGAYGVEVESFITQVNCFDLEKGEFIQLSHQQCQFAYRDSLIKRAGQGQYLVTSVEFELKKRPDFVLSYKPLKEFFSDRNPLTSAVTAQELYDRVCDIRREKLPDPNELANAGSFFKNPVIDKAQFNSLKERFPKIVGYPQKDDGNQVKVAAGWLIDSAGLKGKIVGKVGVHKHQALVLVNYGEEDGGKIWALAKMITEQVSALFNIELEPEVRLLGVEES